MSKTHSFLGLLLVVSPVLSYSQTTVVPKPLQKEQASISATKGSTLNAPALQGNPQRDQQRSPVQVSTFFEVPKYGISLLQKTDDEESNRLNYDPNSKMYFGFGLGYWGYGIKFGFQVDPDEKDTESKGKTNHFDILLSKYWENIGVDLFYEDYKGMYSHQGEDDSTSSDGQAFTKRPDIHLQHYGTNVFYVFSPETYQMRRIQDRESENLPRGGSWLAMLFLNHSRLRADKPLGLESKKAFAQEEDLPIGGNFTTAGIGGGYGYILPVWKGALTGELLYGVGSQYQESHSIRFTRTATGFAQKISLGMTFFQTFGRWTSGLFVKHDQINSSVKSIDLETRLTSATIFVEATL